MDLILEHFRTELKFIQAKVKSLETPHRGETVEHNGIRFLFVEDCAHLLKTYNFDVGFFLDFCSTMVIMGGRGKDYDGKESSDVWHSARRTGSTIKTNMLLAAMARVRPEKIFAKGGQGALVPISEGIIGSLPGNGPAVEIARLLCYRVLNQWNNFVSAIERTHTKLVAVTRFSEKIAWKLMGRYGVAVFEAMQPYRAAAAQLENPKTLDDQAALPWVVLQCHRVVDKFMVNFEGHPAIVREMSLFILTERVDPIQFAAVAEQNKEVSQENAALAKRVKALEESQNAMKRQIDSLSNELKQIKKKS
ncbi:unnamed protein product [Cylindrotheca closterium]|uniref:Uncharacterized protein n=1 Tax=Cylindrotheca closterium TaxID=2856 RepID=A0AAD2CSU6_9STRA|nr:unnamed protein product [Cylindrotheca closterium]